MLKDVVENGGMEHWRDELYY